MKNKLYIVRRDDSRVHGPMNIKALSDALQKMDFGTQDEICGHCGPWVTMDQRQKLRTFYPEIEKIVQAHNQKIWNDDSEPTASISVSSGKNQGVKYSPSFPQVSQKSISSPQSNMGIVSLLVMSAICLFGAIHYRGTLISYMSKDKTEISSAPNISANMAELAELSQKDDPKDFILSFEKNLPALTDRFVNHKDSSPQLLINYFRLYAFFTTGDVAAVNHKVLKGAQANLPLFDCTQTQFSKKWDEFKGGPYSFASGNFLPKNMWTKVLAYDPYWIKRRSTQGWTKPKNYFEGCLIVAYNTLETSTKSPKEASFRALIKARLEHQMLLVTSKEAPPAPVFENTHLWPALSCQELSLNYIDLLKCKVNVKDQDHLKILEENHKFQLLRIALKSPGHKFEDPVAQKELRNFLASAITKESTLSRFDYEQEVQMIKSEE